MPTTITEPSVPIYKRTEVPAHLRTYSQLKAAGLRPACATRPDGAWRITCRDKTTVWMWLYDVHEARIYVCTTKHAGGGRRPGRHPGEHR